MNDKKIDKKLKIIEQLENNSDFVDIITEASKNMSAPMTFEEFKTLLNQKFNTDGTNRDRTN
jgi:hypothetical protein